MFAQAMKGSHQKALECVDWMIAYWQNRGLPYDGLRLQACRQERAVIWRLMGENDRALEEFNALLALQEDYECLAQMSYLKHLMEDTSGALEYARRAKGLQRPELEKPGFLSTTVMTLGFRALPDEYRRWLVNVGDPYSMTTIHLHEFFSRIVSNFFVSSVRSLLKIVLLTSFGILELQC